MKHPRNVAREPRVLVVDESDLHREQVAGALRGAGMHVLALMRAEAVVPLFSVFRPDALVLATHAPEFASVAMARRIQEQSRGTVPILYLIDAPDPELRRHCLERGHGLDALAKPLDLRELVAKLQAHLRFRASLGRARRALGDSDVAVRDPLTGTFTPQALLGFVGQELRRCERHGGGFGVLALQLESLREFKRAFGGGMTERLVVFASGVLLQGTREADVAGRFGEDRFAVLLPGTSEESAPVIRARLEGRFERAFFQVEGRVIRTPAAIGWASFPEMVGSPRRIVTAAFDRLARPDVTSAAGASFRAPGRARTAPPTPGRR